MHHDDSDDERLWLLQWFLYGLFGLAMVGAYLVDFAPASWLGGPLALLIALTTGLGFTWCLLRGRRSLADYLPPSYGPWKVRLALATISMMVSFMGWLGLVHGLPAIATMGSPQIEEVVIMRGEDRYRRRGCDSRLYAAIADDLLGNRICVTREIALARERPGPVRLVMRRSVFGSLITRVELVPDEKR